METHTRGGPGVALQLGMGHPWPPVPRGHSLGCSGFTSARWVTAASARGLRGFTGGGRRTRGRCWPPLSTATQDEDTSLNRWGSPVGHAGRSEK